MLPLIQSFKTKLMKGAPLLTVALGMFACTQVNNNAVAIKDTAVVSSELKNGTLTPVVKSDAPEVNTAPELPFFKDVFDAKNLFW